MTLHDIGWKILVDLSSSRRRASNDADVATIAVHRRGDECDIRAHYKIDARTTGHILNLSNAGDVHLSFDK